MGEHIDVLVIGAGQGGLSASYFLTQQGVPHLVLERGEVGNAWRTDRWDSFTLVTPNWTIRLPGAEYQGNSPDAFMGREEFVAYLERWAKSFKCPLSANTEVTGLSSDGSAIRVETSEGALTTANAIIATGTYQRAKIPAIARQCPVRLCQLDARQYRSPDQLPDGAALVVGSGQTGCQIADEINKAGREVYLCVGRAGRLPRRFRGRDALEWQLDMGFLDRTPDMLDAPADRFRGDPHVSGKNGGQTLSLHDFRAQGIHLLGRLKSISGEVAYLAKGIQDQVAYADQFAADFRKNVDAYIAASGVVAPAATPEELAGDPVGEDWVVPDTQEINFLDCNINTIVWATGFSFDFSWINFPVIDGFGYPITKRGVTSVPGLYFVGLNWMYKKKSGIIYGVGEDAEYVTSHVMDRLKTNPLEETRSLVGSQAS
ncbi:MAG: NAD(P)-binding domain-containing protein [Gammaproteobacteria bacterium]|jgi:putative flavoprotein involved in K+ transport|nr:NAD(P)-binding domain-containing protein [Gammaproteobacteria bacterium]|tara:strand:+ start:12648 stop:13937 length:1290 start_codon:yes stop_codon:yes gene_type:complete